MMYFLHGALGSAAQFNAIQPLIQGTALDFPGHGRKTVTEPFSLRLFAQSVLDEINASGEDQVEIFGYSMGGYVALYLAAHFPERIRSVITLGTKLEWSPEVAAGMNRMFDPEKIEAKVPAFAAVLAETHVDWKAVCRETAAFLEVLGNGGGLTDADFGRIQCPVVIGWGDQDHVVTEAESRRVAGLIPQGELEILPDVKHVFEQNDPESIKIFVDRVSKG